MNQILKIDTGAAVVFTNRLEQLHRAALPNAIRNTLNRAAFDVKQMTMPISSKKHFTIRKENFFKANSRVVMAKGYDINNMKAAVGFYQNKAKYNNKAVLELEQQEYSGTINKRSFIPLKAARSGGSQSAEVLPSNRLRNVIKLIVDPSKQRGKSRKAKFVIAAVKAGRRGFVMGNFGKQSLFRITSIRRDENKNTIITKVPIYSHKSGRSVRIKRATGFMGEASRKSAGKLNTFYISEANRQINRVFRK